MEVKTLQDIFIKILRSELTGTKLDSAVKEQITPDVISALYPLSKKHNLAHIVSDSLYKQDLLEVDSAPIFKNASISALCRYEQMKFVCSQICETFNEAKISYILLKGSVIRPYYKEPWMRTSCDIDILIREEQLNKAIDVLVQKGFVCGDKNYHDISLFSPSKIHLELHFNLLENMNNLDAVLKFAWDYAVPTESSEFHFTQEFFVFHMFAHWSYHFLLGGCGIKALMDIWVMKNEMAVDYSVAKKLLEKAGIYKFAKELSTLTDICFANTPKDEFSEILLSYILDGGAYGTADNRIVISKAKFGNTFSYVLKRFFLHYKSMKIIYPILSNLPFLLPVCWVVRFFEIVFSGKSKSVASEIKIANSMSEDKMDTIKQMRSRLGL